jgi:hypothetical protein
MNENDLIERERRGQRAKEFVNHPEMVAAFEAVRKAYLDATTSCDPKDDRGRHNLVLAAVIVDKVRDHIGKIIQDGDLATRDLKEIRDQGKPRNILGIV